MPKYRHGRPFDIIRDIKQDRQTGLDARIAAQQNEGKPAWTLMTPLLSGWVYNNTGAKPAYRIDNDDQILEIIGRISGPPTSGQSDLFQFPTDGSVPIGVAQARFVTVLNADNVFEASVAMPRLFLATTGDLSFHDLPTNTAGVDFYCTFSTDAT